MLKHILKCQKGSYLSQTCRKSCCILCTANYFQQSVRVLFPPLIVWWGAFSLASPASLSSALCSPPHYHLFSHLTDASSIQCSYTPSLTTFTPFCSIFISTLLCLPNTSPLHLSLTFSFSFVYFVFFSFFPHMCLSFAFYCD